MSSFLKIAACSYEGSIFGWNVAEDASGAETDGTEMGLNAHLDFAFNTTTEGSLKAIAVSKSGKYLVVGGVDMRMRIYNMEDKRAIGDITTHNGGITSLEFFDDSFLLSGSEDNTLCLWRVQDWQCVHIMGGHKGAINDFAIHPTGKLALSVSRDSTMKMWNLVQGRCAFTRKLKRPAQQVKWLKTDGAKSGSHYLLLCEDEVLIYTADDNVCLATLKHSSRVNGAVFTSIGVGSTSTNNDYRITCNWKVVTICEDKTINMFEITGQQVVSLDLSSLGGGRPKDIWSSPVDIDAISNTSMRAVLDEGVVGETSTGSGDGGHCLSVATSMGCLAVISSRALVGSSAATPEAVNGDDDADEAVDIDGDDSNSLLTQAVLSFHPVRGEPRLLAVTAWTQTSSVTENPTSSSKRKRSKKKKGGDEDGTGEGEDIKTNQTSDAKDIKEGSKKRVKIAAPPDHDQITVPKSSSGISASVGSTQAKVKIVDKKSSKKRKK